MHCKDVAPRVVDVDLTPENIDALMKDWRAYKRTEFLVLIHGDDMAVVELHHARTGELFTPVESYEIISLPEDTVYVELPDFDILNIPALAKLQMQYPGKTVVMKGMFSHLNFVSGMKPLRLRVIDNVPPEPLKLGVLVEKALESGYIEKPIVPEFVTIDMADKIKDVKTEAVMFPCGVSGLKSDKPFYFLDQAPKLEHEVTLIGCHLSERIYRSLYGKDPILLNVCPDDYVVDDGVKTITKCCKVKNGHIIENGHACVPWGATVPEVVDAINDLFSDE